MIVIESHAHLQGVAVYETVVLYLNKIVVLNVEIVRARFLAMIIRGKIFLLKAWTCMRKKN